MLGLLCTGGWQCSVLVFWEIVHHTLQWQPNRSSAITLHRAGSRIRTRPSLAQLKTDTLSLAQTSCRVSFRLEDNTYRIDTRKLYEMLSGLPGFRIYIYWNPVRHTEYELWLLVKWRVYHSFLSYSSQFSQKTVIVYFQNNPVRCGQQDSSGQADGDVRY